MKVYLVGGAVRDIVLGLTPKDRDYVVVGATEQEMLNLGYTKVGADFPVFLHPTTKEEYALARKERKTGVGYNAFDVQFDPSVTLEEDLSRRDLTMNAMAIEMVDGTIPEDDLFGEGFTKIIDPFSGYHDIEACILRHVSDAFAEDPVRVLRAARFAARYGFNVHPDTLELMRNIAHELTFVPHERIWAEFEKGLMEPWCERMIEVLNDCGALDVPAIHKYRQADVECLREARKTTSLEARFAVCASAFNDITYSQYCIPNHIARVAKAFNAVIEDLMFYIHRTPMQKVEMFNKMRAFSNDDVLNYVLEAWILVGGKGILVVDTRTQVLSDLRKMRTVDAAAIAAAVKPSEIKAALTAARIATLA